MGETSLSDLDPEQLRELLSVAEEHEAADSGEESASSCPSRSLEMTRQQLGSWIDQYKLVEYLGEGGMAIVYLAEQEYPVHRKVALKLIKPGMDSKQVIARFEMERQTLTLLNHPNIAQIHDAGTTKNGRPYFVMEYVKGFPITEHCDRHKLTIEERLNLFQQICLAVHHAHQKGIIHRDIKPSNILVSFQDDQAVPKIIDFGVAKAINQPMTERTLFTEQGQLFGTPEYMSPEQADMANEDIDTRSDIYSLGVLLYVLLTGALPFDTRALREGGFEHLRQVIRETDPKTPSTRLSSLGEQAKKIADTRRMEVTALAKCLQKELEWIPLKAMQKERTRRYRSASELADDIGNYLQGAPLIAGPESTVYRIKKFVRRHRHFVTASGIVIVSLVLGLIVSMAMYLRSEQSREQEAAARAEAQAVSDFLSGSVIELIDPYKVASGEITRRSLIDAMSENLEQKFTGPPFSEAQIRYTLGHAYWSIGVYELAESYLKPAIEVCQDYLGPEHPTTLEWTLVLGWTYLFQGRFHEAEQLFTKTLDSARRVMGESHKETVHAMWSLGLLYWRQGRYEEAESLSEEAVEISMRQWGEEDPNTVRAISSLVWIYFEQSRYEEAEQLASKALAINLRLRGEKEFWTLNLKVQIAAINLCLGRYEQAEQLGLEHLDGRRNLFGETNVDTLSAMHFMGIVYYSQGRYEDAESLFNKVLTTAQRKLGNTHHTTVSAMYGLGAVYLIQGQYDRSEQLLSKALEIQRSLFGEEHPETLRSVNSIAVLCVKQKKYDQAERFFDEALEGRRLKLGEGHPDTLQTVNDYGVLRREQQLYEEADSLFRQALEGRRRKLGDDHPVCFESMHELAVLYKLQERYEEAEPLLMQALKGRRLKLGDTHPHTIESWNHLISLYEAWNKPEKANEWRTRLEQIEDFKE